MCGALYFCADDPRLVLHRGYSFVQLVDMLKDHGEKQKGERPAAYFFDMFVLNQHVSARDIPYVVESE